jgi:cell wall-associated NlpC family hydrolase
VKPLTVGLVTVLTFLLGVPILVITMGAIVITPAVAEQIRIDPCSAYADQTNIDVTGGEEAGVGFALPKWGTPRFQSLHSPAQTIPTRIKALYVAAANRYRIPWQLLAGIGMAETRHGRNNHTSSAGAQGLMQFMPATFAAYGVDGNHDGLRDIHNDADSIFSAASYLTHSGVTHGARGVVRALWAYNHSVSYRNDVLYYAWSYAGTAGQIVVAGDREDCGDGYGDGNPNLPPLTSERVARMFAWAEKQRGKPYIWGGTGPRGYDCSGFVGAAFRQIGIRMPRTAESIRLWAHKNGHRIRPSQARPGDLVFTNTWRGPSKAGHIMLVYNPKTHTSWEARSAGVRIYHYTDFARHHLYEFWRVGNLTD